MRRHDIYFAGGCFWGVEKYFSLIPGVVSTRVGYANGSGTAPTYEEVCENTRGFVECVHAVSYTHLDVYKRQHRKKQWSCTYRTDRKIFFSLK